MSSSWEKPKQQAALHTYKHPAEKVLNKKVIFICPFCQEDAPYIAKRQGRTYTDNPADGQPFLSGLSPTKDNEE